MTKNQQQDACAAMELLLCTRGLRHAWNASLFSRFCRRCVGNQRLCEHDIGRKADVAGDGQHSGAEQGDRALSDSNRVRAMGQRSPVPMPPQPVASGKSLEPSSAKQTHRSLRHPAILSLQQDVRFGEGVRRRLSKEPMAPNRVGAQVRREAVWDAVRCMETIPTRRRLLAQAIQPENGTRRTCSRSSRGTAERDAGLLRTGRLAKVAGGTGGAGPRKAPLGARANRPWLLSWPFVTHTPPNPHIALRRAPPYDNGESTMSRRALRTSTST